MFEATVTEVRGHDVLLDRTLFYPEAGGQSADEGVLRSVSGEARVVDVRKDGEVVWHTVEGIVPSAGNVVTGELDWPVRYRHMQRHTGEHLLAQAFLRVNDAFRVEAVSMRSPTCTIDLRGDPTFEDARAAEAILREVAAKDWRVEAFEVPSGELSAFPLRRPPKVSGLVRLVGVRDADGGWWEMSACGGTHLKSTAFASPIVVLGLERVKGGLTRVSFMAGDEATEYLGRVYQDAKSVAQKLSVPVEKLVERFEATLQDAASTKQELERARSSWGETLAAGSERLGHARFVRVPDVALVVHVLKAFLDEPSAVGIVLSPEGRCGVASTRQDVHAGKTLQALLEASGGRGGGKPDVAQGQTASLDTFEDAARSFASTLV
ncbi:alanyl-tRNA synthetase [Deinococcus yavapaiensis KR-236]|uniref:Alanyl-tRNA synthetase n=2 Tax=Deinococcus TaxID=1298 RepID=A0A318SB64_9DEIO|nr:alanyl-tRNA synthetase [Deinococcus yavapaiensis KR-236]